MATTNQINGDLYVGGTLVPSGFVPPTGCINNAAVQAGAGITADKLQHQHELVYSQEGATTAAAEVRMLHVVRGATGSIVAFRIGARVASIGDSTISVDLKKNGTTVLSAPVQLTSAQAAYALVAGTIASANLTADDVLEIVVTVAAGTGTLGKGLFCQAVIREDAAP